MVAFYFCGSLEERDGISGSLEHKQHRVKNDANIYVVERGIANETLGQRLD